VATLVAARLAIPGDRPPNVPDPEPPVPARPAQALSQQQLGCSDDGAHPQPGRRAAGVSFRWDLGRVFLQSGTVLDVPPGSTLEAAIGLANLADPAAQQLASASNGGGGIGWVSN
jgi:hypothetical protein